MGDFFTDELLITPEKDSLYDEVIRDELKNRHIVINQEIDDCLFENAALMILKWNRQDMGLPREKRKKIIIYINTDGGDVMMGHFLISVIKTSVTPIVTVGLARCCSMGSYILASGQTRYCFPNTVVLYHDGTVGYTTSGNKGKDVQKFFDKLDNLGVQFMVENTKMDEEFLENIKDREYYMFANEAKERGIVDKIVGLDCAMDEIL